MGVLAMPAPRSAARPAAPAMALAARVVRDRADLEALAQGWQALECRSADATPFQSLGWVRAIFDFEAARNNSRFDPVIAVLEDERGLLAVLPLERIRTPMRRVLAPLGDGFGQYAGLLLDPAVEPAPAMQRLLAAAIEAAPCDGVSLLKVRDGSPLARGLPDKRIETGTTAGAPYVALDEFADFGSYFATIRTKTRKNMRNARNRLERDGPLEHHVVPPADMRAMIESTLASRASRLREQGLTSRAFRDRLFPQFCAGLASRDDVGLMGFSLMHNGQPIAEQWGFVQDGRYYAYVAARDFSNSEESPGKLHLAEILRAGAEQGLSGCDLGVPAMPYKLTFATRVVTVRDIALPVTLKGWLVVQTWDAAMRPALKALMLRLPAGLRARIMDWAGAF
ncbi:GNAT family N-acetyltransferase [Devosia faecipullorum]|uniref:GNAT family N-acetyltransferase n=1 Tax=Devosia faecipullorum TaxID=2755039 RepID=UPI00187B53D1|nr:GNAT family N-acetyltransferase [Devosia faecipullorum]MBE7732706.1 GNAT family N-acetyltransferase [Devosia faecipullorum]